MKSGADRIPENVIGIKSARKQPGKGTNGRTEPLVQEEGFPSSVKSAKHYPLLKLKLRIGDLYSRIRV